MITEIKLNGTSIYHTHKNFAAYSTKYNAQPWWTYRYNVIPHEWCPRCNNFTPHVGGNCDICEVGK